MIRVLRHEYRLAVHKDWVAFAASKYDLTRTHHVRCLAHGVELRVVEAGERFFGPFCPGVDKALGEAIEVRPVFDLVVRLDLAFRITGNGEHVAVPFLIEGEEHVAFGNGERTVWRFLAALLVWEMFERWGDLIAWKYLNIIHAGWRLDKLVDLIVYLELVYFLVLTEFFVPVVVHRLIVHFPPPLPPPFLSCSPLA